MQLQVYKKDNS